MILRSFVAHVTGPLTDLSNFLILGVEHILTGPDHILFVLSLLLVFESIKEVARLTMAFTLAHSLTLALAGSGVLTVSTKVVEPVIAFSIAYVAIVSVFGRQHWPGATANSKVAIVFVFGLFHGLGFAGQLRDSTLPEDQFVTALLAFNVGIELGQFAMVVWALPLIYLSRITRWHEGVVMVAAIAIGAIGTAWGIERILAA